jgi:5-hydroxyisourate hydrolase
VAEGRPQISTHVLDLERGVPAAGINVVLTRVDDRRFMFHASTDSDGRVRDLLDGGDILPGVYELTFEVGAAASGGHKGEPFFEQVSVVFSIVDTNRSYHVPLLLSPFGLTTYRGS